MTNQMREEFEKWWNSITDMAPLMRADGNDKLLAEHSWQSAWNLRASKPVEVMERNTWLPIKTAPRGGRELILLLTPSRFPQVAYSNTWWTAGFSVECKPTHWLPIPAIDSAMREAGEGENG